MNLTTFLAAVPHTPQWGFSVALIMIFANIFAIAIGRFAIKNPGQGPELPFPKPALWKNFSASDLLATVSFGHILGAGLILGLANAGLL
ncbi:MAG: photosystem I reaction center subunit PsaK [Jaaginema sp. PMC 1079.18]|nr:photosystem I reaction center subunit PsaK [Jaaginema sp. PMC 1080.18]MEC4851658.1 photosystem I reaction center subunit PsaK [Jaaginema sp. PMC 1079.18]MEC4867328.1 photosystem I reaction center subunit PsaK [Jaaginema sp. PMC 1078.18]